jgi:hypothetical protein
MALTVATIEVGGTGATHAVGARENLGAAPTAAYEQANLAFNQANSAFTAANNAFPTINIVNTTAVTAVRANHYILKNASPTTVTLPATPNVGDLVWITVANGLITNNVARNGNRIQSLTEDLTLNLPNVAIQMRYADSSLGWIFS